MNNKELKQFGIFCEHIDNGYGVAKTLKFTHKSKDIVITVDKDDWYGIKCYVMEVNGKEIQNFFGKTLRWYNLDDIKEDVLRIFNGDMPKNSFTFA